jgi:hypothetical protein
MPALSVRLPGSSRALAATDNEGKPRRWWLGGYSAAIALTFDANVGKMIMRYESKEYRCGSGQWLKSLRR